MCKQQGKSVLCVIGGVYFKKMSKDTGTYC